MSQKFIQVYKPLLFLFLACFVQAFGTPLEELQVHAFISQGYLKTSANNYLGNTQKGTFEFNEVGINLSTHLTETIRCGGQLFVRDVGRFGNNQPSLDWALLDYRPSDYWGVRIGKIKEPLGYYNADRDLDFVRTWILLPQGVYAEKYREYTIAANGLSFYGLIPLAFAGDLSYELIGGTISFDSNHPIFKDAFNLTSTALGNSDYFGAKANSRYVMMAALDWTTPLEGLRLGASGLMMRLETGFEFPSPMGYTTYGNGKHHGDTEVLNGVLSCEYIYKSWIFSAEYWYFKYHAIATNALVGQSHYASIPPFRITESQAASSFYTSLEYRFKDKWTLGSYYSVYYPNNYDKNSSASRYQKDLDLTLRYDVNDYWNVKIEGHRINGYGLLSTASHFNDLDRLKKNWYLFALKTTVQF